MCYNGTTAANMGVLHTLAHGGIIFDANVGDVSIEANNCYVRANLDVNPNNSDTTTINMYGVGSVPGSTITCSGGDGTSTNNGNLDITSLKTTIHAMVI